MPPCLFQRSASQRKEPRQLAVVNTVNVCHFCGLCCFTPSHLARHLLTHTGHRPHQCTLCTLSFTQKSSLKRHMKRIHKEAHPELDTPKTEESDEKDKKTEESDKKDKKTEESDKKEKKTEESDKKEKKTEESDKKEKKTEESDKKEKTNEESDQQA